MNSYWCGSRNGLALLLVECRLQQRREALGVLQQQLEELVGVLRGEVRVLAPAREHRFGAALVAAGAELVGPFRGDVAAVERELALGFGAGVADRFEHGARGLVLRRAQQRHDALEHPVVERALVLELERADRVRDVLQRVLDRVRVGVHRVDLPRVAGHVVLGEADAVDRRVAHVDVGRAHVDLGAQDHAAFGVLAGAHLAEQAQRFRASAGRGTANRCRRSVSVPRVSRVSSAVCSST